MDLQQTFQQTYADYQQTNAEAMELEVKNPTLMIDKQSCNPNFQESAVHLTASQPADCQIKQSNDSTKFHVQATKQKQNQNIIQEQKPVQSLYLINRKNLAKWMKSECIKLELTRQTYANALFLMDNYYKYAQFNPNQLLCVVLCQIIISSKINEKKVLYTENMAKTCSIEVQKMLQTQQMLIRWFRYRVNPYNFALILSEYILRWDQHVKNINCTQPLPLFLQQTPDSFLLYQQIFTLSESIFIQFRQLPTTIIRVLFETVVKSKISHHLVDQVLDEIFKSKNVFARNEQRYIIEQRTQSQSSIYSVKVKAYLNQQMSAFQKSKEGLIEKYLYFRRIGKRYSDFINIQL